VSRRRKRNSTAPNPFAALDGAALTNSCCRTEVAVRRIHGVPTLALLHDDDCPALDGDLVAQGRAALAACDAAEQHGLAAIVVTAADQMVVVTAPDYGRLADAVATLAGVPA
jgi:hypothetical protein